MSPSSILSRRLVGKPIDSRRLLPDVPRYEDGVADLGSSVVSAQPLLDNSPTGYDNTDYPSSSDNYPSGSDFYSANPTRHVWDEQNPLAANRSSMNPLDRGISVDSGTASPTSSGNITAADTPKAVTDYQEYAQHPELHGGDPKSSFWRRLGGALIDTAGTWGQGFGVPRAITHHLAQDVRYGPDAAHAKENYWQNLPLMRDAANMAEKQQEIGLRQRQLDESAKYRATMMQANADRYAQMERDKTATAAINEGGRPIPTGPTMQQSLGSFDTPAIPPSVETGPRSQEEDVQNLPSRQTSLLQQPLTQNMTPENMTRRTIPAGPGGPAYQMAIPSAEELAQQKTAGKLEPTPAELLTKYPFLPAQMTSADIAKVSTQAMKEEIEKPSDWGMAIKSVAPPGYKVGKDPTQDRAVAQAAMGAMARLKQSERPVNLNQQEATDPATINYYVEQMKQSPKVFNQLSPISKPLVAKAWTKATGLPPPVAIPPQEELKDSASQDALQYLHNAQAPLNNPHMRAIINKRVGAVMGRIGNAEQDAGATAGLSPEESTAIQDFRSTLNYLVFGEGRAMFGNRIPEKLMKKLESSSPKTAEDLAMLQGSINAIDRYARSNIASAERQRFGGKTRPRFTPGYNASDINVGIGTASQPPLSSFEVKQ